MIAPHSLRWFFAAKERRERSSPLLNPSPAYVVERCSLPLSLGLFTITGPEKIQHSAIFGRSEDAELTEHVMILYRRPSENDGGFPVADLPISILNGRLGLRNAKRNLRYYSVKFTTLFPTYVSIILLYHFLIKVESSLSYHAFFLCQAN